jgi:hypothetical protein
LSCAIVGLEIDTTTNILCALASIHISKVHVVDKLVTNITCIDVTKVFSIKASETSSTNNFFDGKITFGHSL